ncbi:accessory Sec system glycosylation chaperone GtfB [Limosilactobacillus allomucosae]|uniref:UDP-N-acetylglucosamine--peptide N-acetylglucosaminyltransferase stabilizing protein GtfB n=1 Tax=Limosilactobacillus allomucosae TaxID=3142938 RepID=A0ABV0I6D0_9LACO
MINLFDKWDQAARDFRLAQLIAQLKLPTVVIHDDGFLPRNVQSPLQYYCPRSDKGQPLYFDQIPVPRFWRIVGSSKGAQIYDLNHKRADVVFTKNDNTRQVKQVRWLNEAGQLQWVDEYDRFGHLFAKTSWADNRAWLKQFFNEQGQVVIESHLDNGSLFLNTRQECRHFKSLPDFVSNYLQKSGLELDRIFYNTLSTSFLTTLKLPKSGHDTLFWHEPVQNKLPGNLDYIYQNQTRTRHVIVQDYRVWQNRQKLFKTNQHVATDYLGIVYPHPRGNSLRPAILILTNSDQIMQLENLVKILPQFEFHVAAITEMSDRLMGMQKYENVYLYPVVKMDKARDLMRKCDIYLDINQGDEILDAVRAAFENNMLILGFNETMHEPRLIADENRYAAAEFDKMAIKIVQAVSQADEMQRLIDTQRQQAGDEPVARFQAGIEALIND